MTTLCSIAALMAFHGPDEIVRVLGYHSLHDGGGGTFVWRLIHTLPAGTLADNGVYFASTVAAGMIGPGKGLWERLDKDPVTVKWYGAKGNGQADDTKAIQMALNSGALRIYLPYTRQGYPVTGLILPGGVSLIGRSIRCGDAPQPVLKVLPGQAHFGICGQAGATGGSLENVAIAGTGNAAFGLSVTAPGFRTEDVAVYGFAGAPGMLIDRNVRTVHTRLHIYDCAPGLHFMGNVVHASHTTFNSLRLTFRAGSALAGPSSGLAAQGYKHGKDIPARRYSGSLLVNKSLWRTVVPDRKPRIRQPFVVRNKS